MLMCSSLDCWDTVEDWDLSPQTLGHAKAVTKQQLMSLAASHYFFCSAECYIYTVTSINTNNRID